MGILNLGILAHVDAGKTSLTERILFETGVIAAIGSVDRGSTQTDTLELERQRGITIKSAVVSFPLNGHKVNLIDTPGHADFIAEVERSLLALDGVVLVVSAVEGIQSQTRRLARVVQALGLPLIVFVNKIDRVGSRDAALVVEIERMLRVPVVQMSRPAGLGSREAIVCPSDPVGVDSIDGLAELLAGESDEFLDRWLRSDGRIGRGQVRAEFLRQARQGRIATLFFGSAITGVGIDHLLREMTRLLPLAPGRPDDPLSAVVFKIQRSSGGEKLVYARIHSGRVARRDWVSGRRPAGPETVNGATEPNGFEERITAIDLFRNGHEGTEAVAGAGEIVRLHGLRDARIDDIIGADPPRLPSPGFNRPTLESVVRPDDPDRTIELAVALQILGEQDPLIESRNDERRGELSVRLYGEVQKEVIAATLATEFGISTTFEPSHVVCIEIPTGSGAAIDHIGGEDNPFQATVGIRVEPNAPGTGNTFQRPAGALDLSFYRAIEESAHETLKQGLHGWPVTDCQVVVTDTAMSPASVAADYRRLTPLVLMSALRRAGTVVGEPVQSFDLDGPGDCVSDLLTALGSARAVIEGTVVTGDRCAINGTIPTAEIHGFERRLPGLSRGEGTFMSVFARYEPVTGAIPERARIDLDPLNRRIYLARVSQT